MSPSAISFKRGPGSAALIRRAVLAVVLLPALAAAVFPQEVDCVAAHVNRRAITLTDLRIIRVFRLGEESPSGEAAAPEAILQKAIDRLVVVDLMRGNFPAAEEEVDARLGALRGRFEPGEWQRLLAGIGITEDGLRSYLENFLQYERMVAIRFGQPPEVTVEEMQNYYDSEYAPARRSAGLEPKPIGDVMGEIEERLREQKREAQISDWVRGLREQSEVRVHEECLAKLR